MIIMPPYIREVDAYWKLPEKDRWIFNKLEICKRFDYEPYGPCGARMPVGTFCVRPIINLGGMALGGFFKYEVFVMKGGMCNNSITDKPGYVWTPWDDGLRMWSEFINDKCVAAQRTSSFDDETGIETFEEVPPNELIKMPEQLKNISRYMLIETIGDTIIDIGPRHMPEEVRQSTIDDYKQFDPSWCLPPHVRMGRSLRMRRLFDKNIQGYTYEEMFESTEPGYVYEDQNERTTWKYYK